MYPEEVFLYLVILIAIFGGFIAFAVHLGNKADQHDEQMRQAIVQCNKDHKEWIFSGKYGFDGFCVTQK
jgi:hypothetical protein